MLRPSLRQISSILNEQLHPTGGDPKQPRVPQNVCSVEVAAYILSHIKEEIEGGGKTVSYHLTNKSSNHQPTNEPTKAQLRRRTIQPATKQRE